ncbi:uncharacterized protein [Macrobrachium rosenbergii]|uniref:uncharacterized protein n=1 Tax=Macrobrachium rosenbergii TaxID=79674 RepID=UPI0034D58824
MTKWSKAEPKVWLDWKAQHPTEQCPNKPQAPPTVPFNPPSWESTTTSPPTPLVPNNMPASSTRVVPRGDNSQSYFTACKECGHAPTWAKCPNNKSSTPTIALAVTNPKSLGPPAKGPLYVGPPRAPPEYNVQWPPPSKLIPDPIPVPGPAPVLVPRHQLDLPMRSQNLFTISPILLECTEQCQAPSVPNDEQIPHIIPVPDAALVSAPEHAPDLSSRDPNPDPLFISAWLPYLSWQERRILPTTVEAEPKV